MFDLHYYNKTLHKIEFEELIKEKGLIPIEDLSPIYGLCYNEKTIIQAHIQFIICKLC